MGAVRCHVRRATEAQLPLAPGPGTAQTAREALLPVRLFAFAQLFGAATITLIVLFMFKSRNVEPLDAGGLAARLSILAAVGLACLLGSFAIGRRERAKAARELSLPLDEAQILRMVESSSKAVFRTFGPFTGTVALGWFLYVQSGAWVMLLGAFAAGAGAMLVNIPSVASLASVVALAGGGPVGRPPSLQAAPSQAIPSGGSVGGLASVAGAPVGSGPGTEG